MINKNRRAPNLDLIILDELSRLGPLALVDLRRAVARSDRLLPEDRVPHNTRKNEQKWESDVSNLVQPGRGLTKKGYTRRIEHDIYEITKEGESYRLNEHAEIRQLEEVLSNLDIDLL